MKKYIMIAVLAFGLLSLQSATAQVATLTGTSGLTLDTITNADATSFKTGKVSGNNAYLIVKFTKLTGTVAGSVKWEGSLDNTVFFAIATDTLTDATNNYGHSFRKGAEAQGSAQWLYLRVTVATTGTSTASVSAKALSSN